MKLDQKYFFLPLFFLLPFQFLCAEETQVTSETEAVEQLHERLTLLGAPALLAFDLQNFFCRSMGAGQHHQGQSLGYPRPYAQPASKSDKQDIRYILLTLANKSMISLAKERDSLECAGDRIDHLHPFNFLYEIFSDEELKVAVKNIRSKGWLWCNFLEGVTKTMDTEWEQNNLTKNQLRDFSTRVCINPEILEPAFDAKKWEQLVNLLIKHIPRNDSDEDRYDF